MREVECGHSSLQKLNCKSAPQCGRQTTSALSTPYTRHKIQKINSLTNNTQLAKEKKTRHFVSGRTAASWWTWFYRADRLSICWPSGASPPPSPYFRPPRHQCEYTTPGPSPGNHHHQSSSTWQRPVTASLPVNKHVYICKHSWKRKRNIITLWANASYLLHCMDRYIRERSILKVPTYWYM